MAIHVTLVAYPCPLCSLLFSPTSSPFSEWDGGGGGGGDDVVVDDEDDSSDGDGAIWGEGVTQTIISSSTSPPLVLDLFSLSSLRRPPLLSLPLSIPLAKGCCCCCCCGCCCCCCCGCGCCCGCEDE